MLYLNFVKYIDEYNIYDVSQIISFFANKVIVEQVPSSLWEDVLVKALYKAIDSFDVYAKQQDIIDKPSYLQDFITALIAYSFGPSQPEAFWATIEKFLQENMTHLSNSGFENLLFVFT